MILLIGVLVVLLMGLYAGYSVSKMVPDEVEPVRAYVQLLPDVLLLTMTAFFLAGFGWGYVTVIALVLLIMGRALVSFNASYPAVSGALVAGALFLHETFLITMLVLALALNYTAGTLEHRLSRRWIAQPVMAIAATLLIGWAT